MIKERNLLKLTFITELESDVAKYESFCKFIGIVPINLQNENILENVILELFSLLENKLEFDLSETKRIEEIKRLLIKDNVSSTVKLKEFGNNNFDKNVLNYVTLKEILQERFLEDMEPFDELLNIFQSYNLYPIFNVTDMLRIGREWLFEGYMAFCEHYIYTKYSDHKEIKEMGKNISETLLKVVPLLEELQKKYPNNPFVLYAILFCKKEAIFISTHILDGIQYYELNLLATSMEELLKKEPEFKSVLFLLKDLDSEATPTMRLKRKIVDCLHPEYDKKLENFCSEYKLFWYKNCIQQLYTIGGMYYAKSYFERYGIFGPVKYEIIFQKYIKDKDVPEYEKAIHKFLDELITPFMKQPTSLMNEMLVIRTFRTMMWIARNQLRKASTVNFIDNIRKRYLEKVKQDYILMFGEYWKVFYKLFYPDF